MRSIILYITAILLLSCHSPNKKTVGDDDTFNIDTLTKIEYFGDEQTISEHYEYSLLKEGKRSAVSIGYATYGKAIHLYIFCTRIGRSQVFPVNDEMITTILRRILSDIKSLDKILYQSYGNKRKRLRPGYNGHVGNLLERHCLGDGLISKHDNE
mgnify:CR=1 FL=1